MRVFTTAPKSALETYIPRWLDSRENWPKGTDFRFYTEGFKVDCPGKDLSEIPELEAFKKRHQGFRPPDWRFDVVRFANIAFAAYDALYDYKGIGIRLDGDCVTYKKLPKKLIEEQVKDAYLACYQRVGLYTETGFYIVNCAHPKHKEFMDTFRDWYLSERFKHFPHWHDCIGWDWAIRQTGVPVKNLSGEHGKSMHPQALSEFGKYIDHQKGARKELAKSPENAFR